MVNQEGAISGFHGEIMAFMDWFEGFLSETLDMDGMWTQKALILQETGSWNAIMINC